MSRSTVQENAPRRHERRVCVTNDVADKNSFKWRFSVPGNGPRSAETNSSRKHARIANPLCGVLGSKKKPVGYLNGYKNKKNKKWVPTIFKILILHRGSLWPFNPFSYSPDRYSFKPIKNNYFLITSEFVCGSISHRTTRISQFI